MVNQKKVFSNAAWMIGEKLVNVIGIIFINSYMAKYVGPESFGKIVFATSLFMFVQTFSWFGMQNVLFKRMSSRSRSGMTLGLSTRLFRNILLFFSSFLVLNYLYFFGDEITFIFGIANCIASYYIVGDIFSTYNNSQLISYINTITNTIGLGVAFICRFLIAYFSMPIYWFVIPIVLIPMVPYFLRKLYFLRKCWVLNYSSKQRKIYTKYAIKTGGALTLSTLSIIVYTQISSVFLAKIVAYSELAIYSVAMTLGGGVGIVTQALITSYFSRIYQEKKLQTALNYVYQINLLVIISSLLTLVIFSIIGDSVVLMLYGEAYSNAISLILIAVIGTMFSGLGTVCARFMMRENGYKYLSIKMFIVSLFAIPCSYFLILYFGAFGAVLSFLLIELFSSTVANYFFKNQLLLHVHFGTLKYLFRVVFSAVKIGK